MPSSTKKGKRAHNVSVPNKYAQKLKYTIDGGELGF